MLKKLKSFLYQITIGKLDYHLISHINAFRNSSKLLYQNDRSKLGRHLCVFSQYNHNGELPAYCQYYLEQLKKAGCDIILVSTSPFISDNALKAAKRSCRWILCRKNLGYDFYSYREGLLHCQSLISQYDKIIFANDSVFGPLHALQPAINLGDTIEADWWGITDNYEHQHHLQSYFLAFSHKLASSKTFLNYWKSVRALSFKRNIIIRYELGTSRFFSNAGYTFAAYCDYRQSLALLSKQIKSESVKLQQLQNNPKNPTHYLWDHLVQYNNMPFIKREVLTSNPNNLELSHIEKLIKQHTAYDFDLIRPYCEKHLNESQ